MVRLLLIDDERDWHRDLAQMLDGYHLSSAYDGESGISAASSLDPDVILLDINLPDMSGLEVLKGLDSRRVPVVMLTAYGETRLVVEAVRAGAFDYVVKSSDIGMLEDALRRAAAAAAFRAIEAPRTDHPALRRIVGSGPSSKRLRELVELCAASDSPVCIMGESGTGKELVAEAVHALSRRRDKSFVAVNCGAIPDQLAETELFGSEPGAFTDARSRAGSFERAQGGTLFLDEIGEMSPAGQVKLLRAVEQKRICRVGGERELEVDARIVAATNQDLRAAVAERRFREDLFYRIGVLVLRLTPLRERLEDVPVLASHFLRELSAGRKEAVLSQAAAEKLMAHRWPGNVRELRNVIERAILLHSTTDAGSEIPAEAIVLF